VRHDTTDAHRPLKQSVLPGIDWNGSGSSQPCGEL